jgi:hypothetical protein
LSTWNVDGSYTLSLTNVVDGMSGDCRIVMTGGGTITIAAVAGRTRKYLIGDIEFALNTVVLGEGVYHLCFTAGGDWIDFNIGQYE